MPLRPALRLTSLAETTPVSNIFQCTKGVRATEVLLYWSAWVHTFIMVMLLNVCELDTLVKSTQSIVCNFQHPAAVD